MSQILVKIKRVRRIRRSRLRGLCELLFNFLLLQTTAHRLSLFEFREAKPIPLRDLCELLFKFFPLQTTHRIDVWPCIFPWHGGVLGH